MNTTLTWKEIYSLWADDKKVECIRKNSSDSDSWTIVTPGSELRDDYDYREAKIWYVYEGYYDIVDHEIEHSSIDQRKLLFSGTKDECQKFFNSIEYEWVKEPDMETAMKIYIEHFPNWRNWYDSEVNDTKDAWKQGVAWARKHCTYQCIYRQGATNGRETNNY